MKPILVLGLGNPLLGDDGVGMRVIQALQLCDLPPHVEAMDGGTPGVGLIHLLEGRHRVVIVDAAEMGLRPGEIVRFRPQDVALTGSTDRLSLHGSDVAGALALADALGISLPEIVVYGVQPEQVDWGEGLSPAVAVAVPGLVQAVLEETEKGSMADKRILIIDDDPDMVEAIRLVLEANGYQVSHAASGDLGLSVVKSLDPDLIILDVMMETATEGFQVSLALRSPDSGSEYAAYRDIPIVMLTSIHSTTPLRFEPDQDYLPVDVFMEKPIDPDLLLEKVADLLAKRLESSPAES